MVKITFLEEYLDLCYNFDCHNCPYAYGYCKCAIVVMIARAIIRAIIKSYVGKLWGYDNV